MVANNPVQSAATRTPARNTRAAATSARPLRPKGGKAAAKTPTPVADPPVPSPTASQPTPDLDPVLNPSSATVLGPPSGQPPAFPPSTDPQIAAWDAVLGTVAPQPTAQQLPADAHDVALGAPDGPPTPSDSFPVQYDSSSSDGDDCTTEEGESGSESDRDDGPVADRPTAAMPHDDYRDGAAAYHDDAALVDRLLGGHLVGEADPTTLDDDFGADPALQAVATSHAWSVVRGPSSGAVAGVLRLARGSVSVPADFALTGDSLRALEEQAPRFANLQVPRLNPHLAFKLDPRAWANLRGTDQALYNASAAHARTLANAAAAYDALSRAQSFTDLDLDAAKRPLRHALAYSAHSLGELTRARRDAVARAINCPADIMRLVQCAVADDGHLDLVDAAQLLAISRKTQAFTDVVAAAAATRPAAKRKPNSGRADNDKSSKKARTTEPRRRDVDRTPKNRESGGKGRKKKAKVADGSG